MCEIDEITAALEADPVVRVAWLFGSVANDAATPESDVDVAVLAERKLTTEDHVRLIERLAEVTGRPVDLVDLRATGGPILGQVLQNGRRVVCKDPALYAALLTRYVIDEADWMPLYRRLLRERRERWIGQ